MLCTRGHLKKVSGIPTRHHVPCASLEEISEQNLLIVISFLYNRFYEFYLYISFVVCEVHWTEVDGCETVRCNQMKMALNLISMVVGKRLNILMRYRIILKCSLFIRSMSGHL